MDKRAVVKPDDSETEQSEHQHPASDNPGPIMPSSADLAKDPRPSYYCRGCGRSLPRGFRGHFHKECLGADKRRRIRLRRKKEQIRFEAWLSQQHCNVCGARYDEVRSDPFDEVSCEASQGDLNSD